jgi:hypothetical protein
LDGKDKFVLLRTHAASITCLVLLGALLSILFGNSSIVITEIHQQHQLHGAKDYYLGSQTAAHSLRFFGQVSNGSEIVMSVQITRSGEMIEVTKRSGNIIDFNWIFPGPEEYWLRVYSEQVVNISFTSQVHRSSYMGTVIGILLSFLAIPFWLVAHKD